MKGTKPTLPGIESRIPHFDAATAESRLQWISFAPTIIN
jgi:hypothetical protein